MKTRYKVYIQNFRCPQTLYFFMQVFRREHLFSGLKTGVFFRYILESPLYIYIPFCASGARLPKIPFISVSAALSLRSRLEHNFTYIFLIEKSDNYKLCAKRGLLPQFNTPLQYRVLVLRLLLLSSHQNIYYPVNC